jgi:CysZ protein
MASAQESAPVSPWETTVTARCSVCASPLRGGSCTRCAGRIARPDLLAPLEPRAGVGEIATGVELALRGVRLTLTTPRLVVLVVLPLVLSVLIFAGLVSLVWEYRDAVRPDFVQAWPWGLDWLRRIVAGAAEVLGVILGFGLAVVATVVVAQVVNAPFLEWLSQAVESLVLGRPDRTPLSASHLWQTSVKPIFQAIGLALIQATLGLAFLILSLAAVTAPLSALGGLWLVALTLCDVTIARKGLPVRERFRRVRRGWALWAGLALPFFLAPFLLPLGVAGATLATLREQRRQTAARG